MQLLMQCFRNSSYRRFVVHQQNAQTFLATSSRRSGEKIGQEMSPSSLQMVRSWWKLSRYELTSTFAAKPEAGVCVCRGISLQRLELTFEEDTVDSRPRTRVEELVVFG